MKSTHLSSLSFFGRLCALITVFLIGLTTASAVMQVTNGKLYDSNGAPFIIRGTNAMTLYWDGGGWLSESDPTGDWSAAGEYTFSQMTQTGANAARIFWQYSNGSARVPANALDATLQNCVDNNLLPIPELHNATGDASLATFQACVDYWTSPDVVAVMKKYENHIILNIVNEWNVPASSGSGQATDSDIRNAYGPAITAIRNAGLNCPILLDAGRDYAADENAILNNAAYLQNLDPKHNLMFAIHIYDPSSNDSNNRGSQARIKRVMDSMIANNICFVWGEFNRAGYGNTLVEWQYLINYAQTTGTGYLVWAWWDPTDIFSLAYNRQFRAWDNNIAWSQGVTLTENNSIQQTSIKTLTLPQLDAGIPVSNVTLPANPVTLAFSGRNTVFTVSNQTVDANRQGAQVLQKTYVGLPSQKWNLTDEGNGYYRIASVGSGKVLEVAGGSFAVLANVQQGTDYARNFQRWSVTDAGSGAVHLRVRHSGQPPVTESESTADGAPVETYTYTGNTFTITSVAGPDVSVTGVSVNPPSASISVGNSQQLSATVAPVNASNQSVTWHSDNPGVATVSDSGFITGIATGSATITVTTTNGNFTATSAITVVPVVIPPVVILPNGDFEQGFASWSNWGGASIDTVNPHSGTNCLAISAGGAGGGGNFITLAPNTTYTFSAWGKCSAVPASPVNIGVQWDGGAVQHNLDFTSTNYSYQEITFTTPASLSGTNVFIWKNDPAISFYADDINLVQGGGGASVAVTGVSLPPTISLGLGGTQAITAALAPADASNKAMTWSSSNPAVATVSGSGLVTGVALGSATITVTTVDGGFTATSAITITPPVELLPNGDFESGFTAWNDWGGASLDSTNVHGGNGDLKIGSNGAGGAGNFITLLPNTTYTFSAWGKCSATPTAPVNIGVQWDGGSVQQLLDFTDTNYVHRTVTFTTPASVSGANVFVWKSDAAIAFYADDISLMATNTIAVTAVTLDAATAALTVGQTRQLNATVLPVNAINQAVTWNSSDLSVATVSDSGLVTAVTAGSATITVTTIDGGFTATAAITIKNPVIAVTGVTVAPTTLSLDVGATQHLTATVTPVNATNRSVLWSSNNSAVAKVAADGTVTAVAPGNATLTATTVDGNFTSSSAITVKNPVIAVTGITVAPTTVTLTVGEKHTLVATIAPAKATDKTVTWSSNKSSIATVSSTGEVTAIAAGSATITATSNSGHLTATSIVTVKKPVHVAAVGIWPIISSMTVGDQQELSAVILPLNANDKNVTWKSGNPSVATVSAKGIVTARAAGIVTITVTTEDGNKTGYAWIVISKRHK